MSTCRAWTGCALVPVRSAAELYRSLLLLSTCTLPPITVLLELTMRLSYAYHALQLTMRLPNPYYALVLLELTTRLPSAYHALCGRRRWRGRC